MRNGVEGLLIEPKNPAALAMALTQCLTDAGLRSRLGRAGRERAEEFAWPVIANRDGPSTQTTLANRS